MEDVSAAILAIVDQTLADIPIRLFNTSNGLLYHRSDLRAVFKASCEFANFVRSSTTPLTQTQRDHIRGAVRQYFAYAMLSHRWGADEPLYDHITSSIYELPVSPGVEKLQKFCSTVKCIGWAWAWSDTCCIDKTSSAELQESIASMFAWYSNSALTIVYLSDVKESSPSQLCKSEWFTRGWTLQELLASPVVLFYKKNWRPYVDYEPNDMAVKAVVDILKRATRVDSKSLRHFAPGVEHARERLMWARHRVTTREEDIGYSLQGIFGVQLSIKYAEKERAFGRLMAEIVCLSEDITLFDWVGTGSNSLNSCLPSNPSCFETSTHILEPLPLELISRFMRDVASSNAACSRAVKVLTTAQVAGPSFISPKFTVSCMAYVVKTLRVEPRDPTGSRYRFLVSAEGLASCVIYTAKELLEFDEGTRSNAIYALARVCGHDLPLSRSQHDADLETIKRECLRRLSLPFVALLLTRPLNDGGPWRRVPTLQPVHCRVNPRQLQDIQYTPDVSSLQIA